LDDRAVKFRVYQRVLSKPGAGPAHDQLVVKDGDGDVFRNVFQGFGPAQNEGLTFGGLKGFSVDQKICRQRE
jgi:hypothetical protein